MRHPVCLYAHGYSIFEARLANKYNCDVVEADVNVRCAVFRDLNSSVVADTSFARIALDDSRQCIIVDVGLFWFQSVGIELSLHEVATAICGFSVSSVTREADDLHAVAQRTRNGVEHIGG